MKLKLLTAIAMIAIAGVASADLYIPNGDFESGSTDWAEAFGGGTTTYTYPATGGSTLGAAGTAYGQMANVGGWGVLVNPVLPGASGGGTPIGDVGVTAGSSYDFSIDLITLAGTAGGGLKVEAWGSNALLGDTGDQNATANGSWTQFTYNWTVPVGTDKLIFVPLWGLNSTVGYDNVGVANVIPEPATMGLFASAAGLLILMRRIFSA